MANSDECDGVYRSESAALLESPTMAESNEDSRDQVIFYTLPGIRYVNLVKCILFLDAIFSLTLWLTGGNGQYFVDNILHFHITLSVFDLALISTFKLVLLFILYSELERLALAQVEEPYNGRLNRGKIVLHLSIIMASLASLAYSLLKGGFIIYKESYHEMHLTYKILCIGMPCFCAVELLISLFSFRAMRKLKIMRILHRINQYGQEVNEEGEAIKKKVNLKRLIALAKPEVPLLLVGSFCLICSSASQTAAPFFFGAVVDAAQKTMADLNRTVITLLVIYIFGAITSMLRSWLFTLSGQRLVARLRGQLFISIIRQEIAFFDTNRTGELTNRLSSDTQVIQNAVTVNISMLVRYLLQIIGSIAFMFVLNPSLTGVLLAVVPVVSLGAVQYGKFVRDLQQKFQDRLAEASTTAEECLSSVRTVRSFVGEEKACSTYQVDIDGSYQVGKKLALAQGLFDGLIGMLFSGAVTLVLWYGGKLVHQERLTAGVLTSFLLYTLQVAMAFGLLSAVYGDFMKAVGASQRIFELMDRAPRVPTEGGKILNNMTGSIVFKNVHFTYPSRPDTEVLKGVSFTVDPGQMVALVGPSGGGKSTIVNLLERFYDPDSGSILLGGEELRELDPKWFRTQLSMVGQEPTLFACSIKDNISYGKESTEDEVVEVAKQANAHDFIGGFEDGYKTLVGERGVRLSGGQKQRVAIARALIMDPSILLLDEATSALDAESEHLVQEAIDRAMCGRTVLIIAHRLSTVRDAAKVVVIDKGEVVEQGSHDELLAQGGIYKKLVLRQLMAGDNVTKDLVDTSVEDEQENGDATADKLNADHEQNMSLSPDNLSQHKSPDTSLLDEIPPPQNAINGSPANVAFHIGDDYD